LRLKAEKFSNEHFHGRNQLTTDDFINGKGWEICAGPIYRVEFKAEFINQFIECVGEGNGDGYYPVTVLMKCWDDLEKKFF